MALTTCPDCGGKVSKAAESCPHCGRPNKRPQRRRASAPPPHRVQTVEQTSKGWKALQLLAFLVFVPSAPLLALMLLAGVVSHPLYAPLTIAVAGSFGLALFARLGAWWNHG